MTKLLMSKISDIEMAQWIDFRYLVGTNYLFDLLWYYDRTIKGVLKLHISMAQSKNRYRVTCCS